MRILLPALLTGPALLSGPAMIAGNAAAAGLELSVEIPRLEVAEYHRPYVAIWLERPDQGFVANLAVWYDLKKRDGEGTKWLKDLRQWWRRSGRELDMPVDGISGATRAPGVQALTFDGAAAPLNALEPGSYVLVVEAAREVGGREVVRLFFDWPPAGPADGAVDGESELGAVTLKLTP